MTTSKSKEKPIEEETRLAKNQNRKQKKQVSQRARRASRREATINIEKYQWSRHQFLFMKKKTKKLFKFEKTGLLKMRFGFKSLIMYREWWKLNSTTPLIHPSFDGYLKLIVQTD